MFGNAVYFEGCCGLEVEVIATVCHLLHCEVFTSTN